MASGAMSFDDLLEGSLGDDGSEDDSIETNETDTTDDT